MDPRIRASRAQEKSLAKSIGGRTTPGSGNGWAVKNDVRNARWSIECKTTTRASFTLTAKALALAERNALLDGRDMAFAVEIQGRSWVVVPLPTFLSLTQEEEE